MAHQAGGRGSGPDRFPEDPGTRAYFEDCEALLEAVGFPSVLLDHRWDVVLANAAFDALFGGVGPHPTAMPHDNFLRFVLFHPEAGAVLGDHESSWCLPMLAQVARAMEEDGQDGAWRAVRHDIARDPIMEAAYRYGLPHWLRAAGPRAAEHDGSVRPLWHPDPRWGRTSCRVVGDTPDTLAALGYQRLTLVLREPAPQEGDGRRQGRRGAGHLRVVR